jgi:hypothetical protein
MKSLKGNQIKIGNEVTHALKIEFKVMVFFDAAFAAFYLLCNWSEYSVLSPLYQVAISAHFPWYIHFSGTPDGNGLVAFYDANFGLFTLLFVTLVNLYLAYRLQIGKETKELVKKP